MKHLTIKALLYVLAGVTLAGVASAMLLFTFQSQRINSTFDSIVNVDEALLGQLQEMYAQGLQTEQATRNVVLNPADKTARKNYEAADTKFRKALQTAQGLAKDAMAEGLRPLPGLWDEGAALKAEVMTLAGDGKVQAATELLNTKETQKWRDIKAVIQKAIETQGKKSVAAYESYKAEAKSSFWFVLGAGLALLAGMAILLALGGRMILNPLNKDSGLRPLPGRGPALTSACWAISPANSRRWPTPWRPWPPR